MWEQRKGRQTRRAEQFPEDRWGQAAYEAFHEVEMLEQEPAGWQVGRSFGCRRCSRWNIIAEERLPEGGLGQAELADCETRPAGQTRNQMMSMVGEDSADVVSVLLRGRRRLTCSSGTVAEPVRRGTLDAYLQMHGCDT